MASLSLSVPVFQGVFVLLACEWGRAGLLQCCNTIQYNTSLSPSLQSFPPLSSPLISSPSLHHSPLSVNLKSRPLFMSPPHCLLLSSCHIFLSTSLPLTAPISPSLLHTSLSSRHLFSSTVLVSPYLHPCIYFTPIHLLPLSTRFHSQLFPLSTRLHWDNVRHRLSNLFDVVFFPFRKYVILIPHSIFDSTSQLLFGAVLIWGRG